MNQNEAVTKLREKAKTSPAANSFFHVCALRKRARSSINVRSLSLKMNKEGFNYAVDDYRDIMRFLADLGFGKLDLDPKGKIKGLKDIRVSLQSIGQIACGETTQLHGFRPRNKFSMIGTIRPKPTQLKAEIDVSINMNGKAVKIQVPKDLTAEEIAALITGFQKVITN